MTNRLKTSPNSCNGLIVFGQRHDKSLVLYAQQLENWLWSVPYSRTALLGDKLDQLDFTKTRLKAFSQIAVLFDSYLKLKIRDLVLEK